MARIRKRKPKLLIINDVSERKRDAALIRDFVRTIYAQHMRTGTFEVVNASKVRNKVFGFIGKQPRYDLVLTGDRGGTAMFTGRQLLGFGKRVLRVPYSSHYHTEPPWPSALKEEASRLGKNPRILILESDVGPQMQTAGKLADIVHSLLSAREDVEVHKVAGVVSRDVLENRRVFSSYRDFNYIAYPTRAFPMRLSELVGEYSRDSGLKGKKAALIESMQKLQKRRGLTGTLPH